MEPWGREPLGREPLEREPLERRRAARAWRRGAALAGVCVL